MSVARWVLLVLGLSVGVAGAKAVEEEAGSPAEGALNEMRSVLQLPPGEAGERFALGDVHGFVHVYEAQEDGRYNEVWTSEYFEGGIGGLFLAYVDADGKEELIVYTDQGRFLYLDPRTYRTIWSNPPHEYQHISAMLVRNIDDDTPLELIFCADGRLVIYDGRDHFEEWRSTQTGLTSAQILVADVDGDGAEEIVLNDGYVFDARFHDLEWESPEIFGERLGLRDVDGDGIPEVIGEFQGRFLRIFDIDLRREKSARR